jgi:N-acyl amino acid synthase of PEP-CTERM/exosortase system
MSREGGEVAEIETVAIDDRIDAETASPSFAQIAHAHAMCFEIVPAIAPSLREAAYRLRYQVYCVEHGFEDPRGRDGLETDHYDDHSVHSLLVHRASGLVAGTVRLILPVQRRGTASLPIGSLCVDRRLRDPLVFPPERTAEISRFAVAKAFRRAVRGEASDAHGRSGRRALSFHLSMAMPYITLGLMKAVGHMAARNGITHLCAIMTPAMLRLIGRLNISFEPLGPTVTSHGVRQPCFAEMDRLATIIPRDEVDFFRLKNKIGINRGSWPVASSRYQAPRDPDASAEFELRKVRLASVADIIATTRRDLRPGTPHHRVEDAILRTIMGRWPDLNARTARELLRRVT